LNFVFNYYFFCWAQPSPYGWARPQPPCVAGLDSASPAWSLAHASDHIQKGIPLLGLETGSHE